MIWLDQWKLARLKVKRTELERLNREVRGAPGKTTTATVEEMGRLNQKLIEVLLEIEKLEGK